MAKINSAELPDSWLIPDWEAPEHIRAVVTSVEGFDALAFNVGSHVGDDLERVQQRREQLSDVLGLEGNIAWLNQVHGTSVVDYQEASEGVLDADACMTNQVQSPCVVMTADCLPLLVTDKQGRQVAAIHAGWRGLQQGIIETCLERFEAPKEDILVWLGPAISKENYEVDQYVYGEFAKSYERFLDNAFEYTRDSEKGRHYLLDLKQLATCILLELGVEQISDCKVCSFADAHCFSHRGGQPIGRMASLIWKV